MSTTNTKADIDTKALEDVLLPQSQSFYDFSPFLSAPAVQTVARRAGNAPLIISIPTTRIPSPLAPNIAPQTIKDLHDFLCGPANGNKSAHRLRGQEIWLSWKRAWDLWNNHYIRGREAPVWIKLQYEKLKKEFQEEREKRRKEEMRRLPKVRQPKLLTTGPFKIVYQDDAPTNRPGRKWEKSGYKKKQLVPTGHKFTYLGPHQGVHLIKEMKKARRLKPGQQKKIYSRGEEAPVVTNPIPLFTESLETKVVRTTPIWIPTQERGTTWGELRDSRARDVKDQQKAWKQRDKANKRNNLPLKDFKLNTTGGEEGFVENEATYLQHVVVRRPVITMRTVEFETEAKPSRLLSYSKLAKSRKRDNKIPAPAHEDNVHVAKGQKQVPVQETEVRFLRMERVSKETEAYATVEEIEVDEVTYRPANIGEDVDEYQEVEVPEWREVPLMTPINRPRHAMHSLAHTVAFAPDSDSDSEEEIDVDYFSVLSDSDDMNDNLNPFIRSSKSSYSSNDREDPIPFPDQYAVQESNGSSGGFLPMKSLPEYQEPEDDGFDFPEWEDALANTVWRPRRVGEKHLKIDIDLDIEEFFARTDLEIDGGVDCGRSPYPVLRSLDKYLRQKTGDEVNFIKKKVWDGVRGTIFNMPTRPSDSDGDGDYEKDERITKMETLHGDYFRDEHGKPRHDFFPLDIRRCDRIDTPGRTREGPSPLLDFRRQGQEVVQYPWQDPVRYYPELKSDDPWWVTPEQERLRDVPPRRHPPKDIRAEKGNSGKLLYTDDTKWKEEVTNDDLAHSKYFVTNLHGETLIINGVEVRKGCVAGPLPDFAVIESPGGQVAFWWGPGGRNWGAGPGHLEFSTHWNTLRSMPGWEHIGLNAGQVWDVLIRDRLRRELTGNRLVDDEDWERWKSAEGIEGVATRSDPMDIVELSIYRGDDFTAFDSPQSQIVEPECFQTEAQELKWLYTRAEPLAKEVDKAVDTAIVWPTPTTFWSLDPSQQQGAPLPAEIQAQEEAAANFENNKLAILKAQKKYTTDYKKWLAVIAKKKTRKVEQMAKKRKAYALPLPPPKKILTAAEFYAAQNAATEKAKEAVEFERLLRKDTEDEASRVARREAHTNESAEISDAAWQLEKEEELRILDEQFERTNQRRARLNIPLFPVKPSDQYKQDQINLVKAKAWRKAAKKLEDDAEAARLAQHRKERDEKEQKEKRKREERANAAEARLTEQDIHRAKRQKRLVCQGMKLKIIQDSKLAELQRQADRRRMVRFGMEPLDATPTHKVQTFRIRSPKSKMEEFAKDTSATINVTQPTTKPTLRTTPRSPVQTASIQSRSPTPELARSMRVLPVPTQSRPPRHQPSAPEEIDQSTTDTQEELLSRDPVDGLQYVLDKKLYTDPRAPKCSQQIAAEHRAMSQDLGLEEYLRRNGGYASLEAYLRSVLKKETVIPDDILREKDENYRRLYAVIMEGVEAAAAATGETPLFFARREGRNFSDDYTLEKHVKNLVEKTLKSDDLPQQVKARTIASKFDSVEVAFAKGYAGMEQVMANLPVPGTLPALADRYNKNLIYCEV